MTDAKAKPGKYFLSDGLKLHFVEWGTPGPHAVVMLHGLRAYAHWFDEFADVAGAGHYLVALDQRGRGASDHASDGNYSIDAYVADLEALRAQLGLRSMTLIGHSMGGTNVINYTAAYPQHVRALVIAEAAPELAKEGLMRMRSELERTPERFGSLDEAREFLRSIHPRASEANLRTRLEWMLRADGEGYVWRMDGAILNARRTPPPPERNWAALRSIKCPTLIVRGELSDLVTRDMVERMVQCVEGARQVEVAGAAHMVIEDNPEGFNAQVLPFLDEVRGGR